MAMSCLLQLTILWHLSKAIRLFLVVCVHYNYKLSQIQLLISKFLLDLRKGKGYVKKLLLCKLGAFGVVDSCKVRKCGNRGPKGGQY
jgi:hypothetical protein